MTRRTCHILSGCIAALLTTLVATKTSKAQDDEGPIVLGQQKRELETFHLDRPSLSLNTESAYTHERDTTPQGIQKFQETFLSQIADIAAHGYFLTPNLVDINVEAGLGVSEAFDSIQPIGASHATSSESNSELYNWDASALFFGSSSVSERIYTRREQQWINQEFGPTIQSITTDSGVSVDFREGPVPTHLSYSHLDNTQNDVSGARDLQYTRDAFNWFSSARPATNQSLDWSYNFDNVDQNTVTHTAYQTQDANLRYDIKFGALNASNLQSTAHYSDESGSFNNKVFRWTEDLSLQHTDRFETHYQYNFNQFSFPGSTTTSNRGLAGFRHRLFESLSTNGNIGVNQTDTTGGGATTEIFANIDLDYQKKVPFGRFTASAGYNWTRDENSATGNGTRVLNQPTSFNDPNPIVLPGGNIQGPVTITDASGLPFLEGVDYHVDSSRRDRLTLTRVPAALGGHISDNQPILLSYRIAPLPANTTDNHVYYGHVRYDIQEGFLTGLGMFSRLTLTDQDIDTAQPLSFIPNEFVDYTNGVDYRFWDFTVAYEHEIHDSTINPFDADRVSAGYNQRVDLDTTASISGGFTSINYTEPVDHVRQYVLAGQLSHRFSNELTGLATALYRNEHQNIGGSLEGFEQQVELNWRHRQTTVYLRVRNSLFNTSTNKQEFQFVQLGLRREF